MTTTTTTQTQEQIEARVGETCYRLFGSMVGAIDVLAIDLGTKLGYYTALSEGGPATAKELADRTKTNERYTREWLEQQSVSGLLDVEDAAAAAEDRRYELPPGFEALFVTTTTQEYMGAISGMLATVGRVFPKLVDAYRTGKGVPFSDYGVEAVELQAGFSKPNFTNFLTTEWLPSIPEIDAKLKAGGRFADVACGAGISSIQIAKAYPKAHVDGIDIDEASIAAARRNAAEAGAGNRLRFEVQGGEDVAGAYDAAMIFEALHDMSHPVEVLRSVHRSLADDGVLLVADERVAEQFAAPGDEVERFMYGASIVWCLPQSLADDHSAGLGTALRPDTLRSLAAEAGFASVEILPIENMFLRFYLLRK